MTQQQIDALSVYNNPANGLSPLACNGTLIAGGGFVLPANTGSRSFMFNHGWQGAFYPRTGCSFDANGIGGCETGNCTGVSGKGLLECGGVGSATPVKKGEMNLDDTDDWYNVSWVDGFNIAMVIEPTQYNPSYQTTDPTHHCATAGCDVGLSSFASPSVPSWNILKYPSAAHFVGILSDCKYYSNLPRDANFSADLWNGYCCPIAEGSVNDTSVCTDVPAGKTCKKCAGQDSSLYPLNTTNALPNSAKLFFDTCTKAYSYTYNGTAALMTCQGTSTLNTSYKVTLSCPAVTQRSHTRRHPIPLPRTAGIVPAGMPAHRVLLLHRPPLPMLEERSPSRLTSSRVPPRMLG